MLRMWLVCSNLCMLCNSHWYCKAWTKAYMIAQMMLKHDELLDSAA